MHFVCSAHDNQFQKRVKTFVFVKIYIYMKDSNTFMMSTSIHRSSLYPVSLLQFFSVPVLCLVFFFEMWGGGLRAEASAHYRLFPQSWSVCLKQDGAGYLPPRLFCEADNAGLSGHLFSFVASCLGVISTLSLLILKSRARAPPWRQTMPSEATNTRERLTTILPSSNGSFRKM